MEDGRPRPSLSRSVRRLQDGRGRPSSIGQNDIGWWVLIVVVMGVTGSGKTTIGLLLAKRLEWEFADADTFHSSENVEKMRLGIPLTDADRTPWLESLHQAMESFVAAHKNVVLACSALKKSYRNELYAGPETRFVYLKGSYDLIAARLRQRHGHFASESILASQFAALEEPDDAISVDIDRSEDEIVSDIMRRLGVNGDPKQP